MVKINGARGNPMTTLEKQRIYDKARYPQRKEYMRLYMYKYRAKNKDKIKARNTVNNAINRGKLKRGVCRCGGVAQAHHKDYRKPFDIEWLCPTCHYLHHIKNKNT